VIFRDTYCEGGHGLSIGSLGKDGQVADVQNVLLVSPCSAAVSSVLMMT
jgi:hypothetical protein